MKLEIKEVCQQCPDLYYCKNVIEDNISTVVLQMKPKKVKCAYFQTLQDDVIEYVVQHVLRPTNKYNKGE